MVFMLAVAEFNSHSKFFGLCSLAGRRVRSLFHVNFIPIYAEVGLLFFVWRFFRRVQSPQEAKEIARVTLGIVSGDVRTE